MADHAGPSQTGPSQTEPSQALFCIRLVSIDYYMAAPIPGVDVCFSHFEGTPIERVPIVRIFGSTSGGQKACLHLHKAFPYFYVPYHEDLPTSPKEASAFMRKLSRGIDTALQMSNLQTSTETFKEPAPGRRQAVHTLQLVRGRHFYGYHAGEQLFIKIVMYKPTDVSRAAMLLQAGAVMGRKFQSFESHIPFLLQLKIDFNLTGMGFIKLSKVLFRDPVPDLSELFSQTGGGGSRSSQRHVSVGAQLGSGQRHVSVGYEEAAEADGKGRAQLGSANRSSQPSIG
eukprot:gene22555-29680_t